MDMVTIKMYIETNYYSSAEACVEDFQLICKNC